MPPSASGASDSALTQVRARSISPPLLVSFRSQTSCRLTARERPSAHLARSVTSSQRPASTKANSGPSSATNSADSSRATDVIVSFSSASYGVRRVRASLPGASLSCLAMRSSTVAAARASTMTSGAASFRSGVVTRITGPTCLSVYSPVL